MSQGAVGRGGYGVQENISQKKTNVPDYKG